MLVDSSNQAPDLIAIQLLHDLRRRRHRHIMRDTRYDLEPSVDPGSSQELGVRDPLIPQEVFASNGDEDAGMV